MGRLTRARLVDFGVCAGFLVAMVGVFSGLMGSPWWLFLMVAGVAVMLAVAAVE